MPAEHFSHVRTWVFDLDHTLYPPEMQLFAQIEIRMINWVMTELGVDRAEADRLRAKYWREHGTTLAGLMRVHGVAPDQYLIDVHDIDFSVLAPDPELREAISELPGRKIIYTNGTAPYAENVIQARGLSGIFDAIYGVEHADFHPKPDRAAFEQVFKTDGLNPSESAMFEDDPRNLAIPHAMGMRTVHVAPAPLVHDHIHHHTDDLRGFLTQLIR
ncbi:pyrimidine 5'-nucleotidase [Litoreibacter janthinus]|uniref:Putative hydrolase of the HAD superfamily n=1 Tax=Litoreibacter janthinus TaxID=670154 RepID=A0A1I6HDL0_9RHOB|nr:pyrimidine 5'-nucleotidase [Litoreibacter janthinus]SFR52595.1 putative hydrolase of the HAD superfamily [Litoreibacter janthinus]